MPDYLDKDDDGDGIFTKFEGVNPDGDQNPLTGATLNTDGDTLQNYLDIDDDNDGYATWETIEGGPGALNAVTPGIAYAIDTDTDGIPNYLDNTTGIYPVNGPYLYTKFVSLIGDKRYELANHLGNVLVVVNDKKIPSLDGTLLTGFTADVLSYSDYYPFGMLVPNRHGSSDSYRYGFQGQEKDDEINPTHRRYHRQDSGFVCCDLSDAGVNSCAGREAHHHESAGEPRHRQARSTGLETAHTRRGDGCRLRRFGQEGRFVRDSHPFQSRGQSAAALARNRRTRYGA